jgi:hypothetical protein
MVFLSIDFVGNFPGKSHAEERPKIIGEIPWKIQKKNRVTINTLTFPISLKRVKKHMIFFITLKWEFPVNDLLGKPLILLF